MRVHLPLEPLGWWLTDDAQIQFYFFICHIGILQLKLHLCKSYHAQSVLLLSTFTASHRARE